jgi:DNA-binding NarL/FixJ family response regulator
MARARLVLADDHIDMAADLSQLLSAAFEVVAVVNDGNALVAAADRLVPDVLVTDITMPGLDGISAMCDILLRHPAMGAIIVTVHNDRGLVQKAFACGARGYVLKASAGDDLIRAVAAVLAGNHFVSASLEYALGSSADVTRH